jgi:hypothetical protein
LLPGYATGSFTQKVAAPHEVDESCLAVLAAVAAMTCQRDEMNRNRW